MKLLFRAGGLLYVHKGSPLIQMLLVMKMTLLLLTVACLQISARTSGQTITLSEKDVPLETIFKKIERQSGYHFFYRYEWLKDTKSVSIDVKNISLIAALDICFKDQPVSYVIVEKNIAVKLKQNTTINSNESAGIIIDVKGKITTEQGEPIAGATITVKGTNKATTTNESGEFVLTGVDNNAILVISSVSFESREIKLTGKPDIAIKLKAKDRRLDSVIISYNTGYQYIPRERATGSFAHIDNELLNRSVSTNIIDRLKGVASGVLFDGNTGTSTGFSVRGRSTIFANTDPLIVLDNFPYDGDLSTINPNDVESITILKDAAAASIWGVRASNGVVVITSKKGRYNQPIRVSVNSNLTMIEKPDLYSQPDLPGSDIIDIEKFLFNKGAYDNSINSNYGGLSPVVEVLLKNRDGTITDNEAEVQLNTYRHQNLKDDLLKYYYRRTFNQQYSVALNGGGDFNKYFLSIGFDKNLNHIVNASTHRITINANNTYSLFKNKLEITTGINFATGKSKAPGTLAVNQPYSQLANEDGSSTAAYRYRQQWLDTIGGGRLLDWKYYPLDELNNANNKSELTNYLLNIAARYRITKTLDVNVHYQYSKGANEINTLYSQETFFTRNLINQFSQIDYTSDNVVRPVPLGDILTSSVSAYFSHSLRANIGYSNDWNNNQHSITALLGAEMKQYHLTNNSDWLYGYDESIGSIANMDYVNEYPQLFYNGARDRIRSGLSRSGIEDRYLSYFGNVAYTYNQRYTISASARKDESNLFGVNANQKGVPLWSVGANWNISKENFYHISWLPDLRIRMTNGYSGNVDKTVSAFTTATTYSGNVNVFGSQIAYIANPPNPSLRWERISITNLAIDFVLFDNRISGSAEYYFKKGKNIIGNSPLAPSTGVTEFRGNSANIKGKGADITINTKNLVGEVKWYSTFLYSYNTDRITNYKVKTTPLGYRAGYPYNALFSYRWAGLDPQNGDPLGYLEGKKSNEWPLINAKDSAELLVYNGSSVPTHFGSLRNTLTWRNISFSFNLIFKAGYYFRRSSVVYSSLYSNSLSGHKDYKIRWQKPGDEAFTSVPSMIYPFDYSREGFYTNSQVLVEKGSQLRLQDIQLSYDISNYDIPALPFQNTKIYFYASNLLLIWKANKNQIDPDYRDIAPQRSLAIGLKIDL